jgi:radical SAM enzyme (TIGR01210 family)
MSERVSRVAALWRTLKGPPISLSGPAQAFAAIAQGDPALQATLAGGSPPHIVRSASEFAAAVVGYVRREVRERYDTCTSKDASVAAIQYLLDGAVADVLLGNRLRWDLTPELSHFWSSCSTRAPTLGPDVRRRIAGAIAAGDSRTVIWELSPLVYGVNGPHFLKSLRVDAPMRAPSVTPTWVKQFQDADRPVSVWLDREPVGLRLFIVHYTQLCGYKVCAGCALPDVSARSFIGPHQIIAQTNYAYQTLLTPAEKTSIRTIILSNNGSVFDEPTFPEAARLHAVVTAASELSGLKLVSLETRTQYLNSANLSGVQNALRQVRKDVAYEAAIGVEIFDETLRNRHMQKGLSTKALERAAELLAAHGGGLRCYFMLKPLPEMTEAAALEDIERGMDYLEGLAQRFALPVTMHLNPTYAAVGTNLEKAFREGRYTPPDLRQLEAMLVRRGGSGRLRLVLGLNDEGLSVQGGSFDSPENADVIERLRRLNRTAGALGSVAIS